MNKTGISYTINYENKAFGNISTGNGKWSLEWLRHLISLYLLPNSPFRCTYANLTKERVVTFSNAFNTHLENLYAVYILYKNMILVSRCFKWFAKVFKRNTFANQCSSGKKIQVGSLMWLPVGIAQTFLRKLQHTPGTYPRPSTRGTQNYKYERISFINRWLRVWSMFQGSNSNQPLANISGLYHWLRNGITCF